MGIVIREIKNITDSGIKRRSGHLGSATLTRFEIEKINKIKYKGKTAHKTIFVFETYTQTEFEHPPPGVRITKTNIRIVY